MRCEIPYLNSMKQSSLRYFFRGLSDVITIAPRQCKTRQMVRRSVEELGAWNDRRAIAGDFLAVGNDLRAAFRKYRQNNA